MMLLEIKEIISVAFKLGKANEVFAKLEGEDEDNEFMERKVISSYINLLVST